MVPQTLEQTIRSAMKTYPAMPAGEVRKKGLIRQPPAMA
jgi:hypothetical protein